MSEPSDIGSRPAFPNAFTVPLDEEDANSETFVTEGMTFRMWLVGVIASGMAEKQGGAQMTARIAIDRADALLDALDAEQVEEGGTDAG